MIAAIDFKVDEPGSYRVSVGVHVVGSQRRFAPALLTCKCWDAYGTELATPPHGFAASDLYGPHILLGEPGVDGDVELTQVVTPPSGAVSVSLILHRWRAQDVVLTTPLAVTSLASESEAQDQQGDTHLLGPDPSTLARDPRVIWRSVGSARANEVYEVTAGFSRPLADRDIVAAIRFTDAEGRVYAPQGRVAHSEIVGAFHYLSPQQDSADPQQRVGCAVFHAPEEATQYEVQLLRWVNDPGLTLQTAQMCARSNRPDLLGSGVVPYPAPPDVTNPSDAWCAFSAEIETCGPDPVLLDLTFLDASGAVLAEPAAGLHHKVPYNNSLQQYPDALSRYDGCLSLHVAFRAPRGTQSVRWHLFAPDGADHRMIETPPTIAVLPPHREAEWCSKRPADMALLDRLLAATQPENGDGIDPKDPVIGKGYTVCARLAASLDSSDWHRLTAQVTRASGGLDQADLILRVQYFADDHTPLSSQAMPGFGNSATLGLHRSLMPQLDDPDVTTAATVKTTLRVPSGAAAGIFEVIACHAASQISASLAVLETISRTEVCANLPLAEMRKPQLIQTLDLAEAAEDPIAAQATLAALSAVDPKTKGYAYRARILAETLALQAPDWLPETGHAAHSPQQRPDPNCIFHLSDFIHPDMSLAAQQARLGVRAVIGLGLGQKPSDPAVLGPILNSINFPAAGGEGLSPTDRLDLETRCHSAAVAAHTVGMIHAVTDGRPVSATEGGAGLKGAALAQAHGVPFVMELQDLVVSRASQVDIGLLKRALTRADQIIVSARADSDVCAHLDLPQDRVSHIPNAIPTGFETEFPKAALEDLRRTLGLGQRPCLGLFCPDGSDTADIEAGVIATLSTLASHQTHRQTHRPPALVLIGSGSARAAHALHVYHTGLDVHFAAFDTLSDTRAQYALCDAMILPARTLPVTLLAEAFKALSQGCNVALSEGPDTGWLMASAPESSSAHISVYDPTEDPLAPGGLWEGVTALLPTRTDLGRPGQTQTPFEATLRWLRTHHSWAERQAAYDQAYAAARHVYVRKHASPGHGSIEDLSNGGQF